MGSRVRSRWRGPRPSARPSQKLSGRGTLLHPQVWKGQASGQNSSGFPYWVCITSHVYPQHGVTYKEGSGAFADGLWPQSLARVHILVALLIWGLMLEYGLLLGVAGIQATAPLHVIHRGGLHHHGGRPATLLPCPQRGPLGRTI